MKNSRLSSGAPVPPEMMNAPEKLLNASIICNTRLKKITGAPLDSLLFFTVYLYNEAFAFLRMGYASALAWVLLLIIALFTAIAFWTSKYWVHYENERG